MANCTDFQSAFFSLDGDWAWGGSAQIAKAKMAITARQLLILNS
jgi:hypothetical protein